MQALLGGVSAAAVLGDDAAAVATIVDDVDNVVCTATFIAPHQVVTAAHCFHPELSALETAIALQSLWLTTSRDTHWALTAVQPAPESDAAIVNIAGTADVFLPARDDLDVIDIASVHVVGAGRSADAYDRRTAVFAVRDAAPLWALTPTNADDGLCPGDSGGPLLVEQNGVWSVVGVHKSGQFDCRGDGHATPLTGLGAWIDEAVSLEVGSIDACDDEGASRCTGSILERCAHGVWRGADCALAQYQCVDAEDVGATCAPTPCGDVSAAGECDGNVALSCRFGSLWRALCRDTEVCALDDVEGRMGCVPCEHVCDNACVSLQDDGAHCGSCSNSCSSAQHCRAGTCVASEGEGEGDGEAAPEIIERSPTGAGCGGAGSPAVLMLASVLRRRARRTMHAR